VDKQGNTYYATQVTCQVADQSSEFNGRMVFDNFVSTMVFPNSGTSKVAAIIRAIGGFDDELRAVRTHEQLAQLFTRALASEPTCRISTRWEATEKTSDGKYNTFLKGMRNFPQNADGSYQHIVKGEDPAGDEITARATVTRYLPIG
jgi:hypothetical protein